MIVECVTTCVNHVSAVTSCVFLFTGLCPEPAVKLNSRVSLSSDQLTEGTLAQYSCDPGFARLG